MYLIIINSGSYYSSIFNFFAVSILFSTVAYQLIFPPTVNQGSLFTTSSSTLSSCPFCNSHSDRYWFWFAFSLWLVMLSSFSSACWPTVYFLWKKNFFRSSAHFFNQNVFCCWVVKVLYIFWMLTPYQIYDLQRVSLILQVAFSFYRCFLFLCCSFSYQ